MTTPAEQGQRVLAGLDEFIANLSKARDDLQAVLDSLEPPQADPTARVTEMVVGGWMQRPGRQRWLPIASITQCTPAGCWRITFDIKPTEQDGNFLHVSEDDTFPFLTAEQFDRACARERAAA